MSKVVAPMSPPVSVFSGPMIAFCTALAIVMSTMRSNDVNWRSSRLTARRNPTTRKQKTTTVRRILSPVPKHMWVSVSWHIAELLSARLRVRLRERPWDARSEDKPELSRGARGGIDARSIERDELLEHRHRQRRRVEIQLPHDAGQLGDICGGRRLGDRARCACRAPRRGRDAVGGGADRAT